MLMMRLFVMSARHAVQMQARFGVAPGVGGAWGDALLCAVCFGPCWRRSGPPLSAHVRQFEAHFPSNFRAAQVSYKG